MSQDRTDRQLLRRQEYMVQAVRLRSYAAVAQSVDARIDFSALAAMYETLADHSVSQLPTKPDA